ADSPVTASDSGRHSFSAVLRTVGTQSLSATDAANPDVTGTANVVVNPAAVNSFAVAGFPSPLQAGESGQFTVTALDRFGNVVTAFNGRVHFTSSDNQATLPGDYTFTADDQGVRTFQATLRTAGLRSLTVTTTSGPLVTGSQTGIEVDPAAVSGFLVAGFPSPQTAGHIGTFTVTAKDPFGNTVPDYVGTVHFTSSDAQATLPGDYTFTLEDQGTHTFGLILRTAGTQSLTAADGTLTGTQNIVVNPAAASKFVFSGYPTFAVAGQIVTFTVTVQDAFGN